jgi:hypothetical protein
LQQQEAKAGHFPALAACNIEKLHSQDKATDGEQSSTVGRHSKSDDRSDA